MLRCMGGLHLWSNFSLAFDTAVIDFGLDHFNTRMKKVVTQVDIYLLLNGFLSRDAFSGTWNVSNQGLNY